MAVLNAGAGLHDRRTARPLTSGSPVAAALARNLGWVDVSYDDERDGPDDAMDPRRVDMGQWQCFQYTESRTESLLALRSAGANMPSMKKQKTAPPRSESLAEDSGDDNALRDRVLEGVAEIQQGLAHVHLLMGEIMSLVANDSGTTPPAPVAPTNGKLTERIIQYLSQSPAGTTTHRALVAAFPEVAYGTLSAAVLRLKARGSLVSKGRGRYRLARRAYC